MFLVEKDGTRLAARVVRGFFPPMRDAPPQALTRRKHVIERVKSERFALGEGLIGLVAQSGQAAPYRGLPQRCAGAESQRRSTGDAQFPGRADSGPEPHSGGRRAGEQTRRKSPSMKATCISCRRWRIRLRSRWIWSGLVDEAARAAAPGGGVASGPGVPDDALAQGIAPARRDSNWPRVSRPALEVGGDFYDLFPLPNGRVGIAIADASGKGIPAALIMATARSALRAEARLCDSPAEALGRVNARLYEDTKENVFLTMTLWVSSIPRSVFFRFARAGHEPLLSWSEGESETAGTDAARKWLWAWSGRICLIFPDEDAIEFKPGETAILYTDGAVEAIGEDGEEFGRGRLKASLRRGTGKNVLGESPGRLGRHRLLQRGRRPERRHHARGHKGKSREVGADRRMGTQAREEGEF